MAGDGLAAEGASFCEKMAVVPVEVLRAASRTTRGPASQPIGHGLEPQHVLGSAWGPWGGRERLLGHLSRISSFDSDRIRGHRIRADLCLTCVLTTSFRGTYWRVCQGDQHDFGFRTKSPYPGTFPEPRRLRRLVTPEYVSM